MTRPDLTAEVPSPDGGTSAEPSSLDSPPDSSPSAAVDDVGEDEPAARRSGVRYGIVALTLALVVGLLLGYAAGWLTPRLTAPGEDSAEAGFARDMTTHHSQAVEMGLIGFQRATDQEVRQVAVDIAAGQQGEIGIMQAWLAEWRLDPTGSRPAMAWMPDGARSLRNGLMPGMASPEEMTRLRAASGRELDVLFLQLMYRHHLGGIHMTDAIAELSDESRVLKTAKTMKDAQQLEIKVLRDLLTRYGAQPLPD